MIFVGFNPIVLLTQVDLAVPDLQKDPYAPAHSGVLEDIKNQVASQLWINVADIVPVVNYSQEHFRTFGIDRCLYVAL